MQLRNCQNENEHMDTFQIPTAKAVQGTPGRDKHWTLEVGKCDLLEFTSLFVPTFLFDKSKIYEKMF